MIQSDTNPLGDELLNDSEDKGDGVVATAGVLSRNKQKPANVERRFNRNPPPKFGELIELVRCLPPHDSAAFRLLHPLIVGIEMGEWPINFETGVACNARFRSIFNEMFAKEQSGDN